LKELEELEKELKSESNRNLYEGDGRGNDKAKFDKYLEEMRERLEENEELKKQTEQTEENKDEKSD
jgi:hypothetical protein